MLDLLNRRLGSLDGTRVMPAERRSRPRPGNRGFSTGCAASAACIHALIIRETRTRFGDARLGYGWALIEPVLHITCCRRCLPC